MKRTFTFRVEDHLWEKFTYISDKNRRSLNNQLEVLVQSFIDSFEKENGEIPLDNSDQ